MLSVTAAPFCETAGALEGCCQELLAALALLPTDRPVRFAFSLSARCCTSCWKDLQQGEQVTPWRWYCTLAACLKGPWCRLMAQAYGSKVTSSGTPVLH